MFLRLILVTHRYVAVAVGLLVALWCLSGFVMMYQGYPRLTDEERLRALQPLALAGCCRTSFLPADDEPLAAFQIEMLLGEPVLRQRGVMPIRLASGTPLETLRQAQVLEIAAEYAARSGQAASPEWLGEVDIDQWTIQTARRNAPAQHIRLRDAADTEIYINGATGEVFQDTNRRERLLSWFGAIPHWLYPTALRQNGPLWSQVVIWTSTLGTFLTVTGLYVGIARLRRRRRDGKLASPFRGWWYWHHVSGLVFGVLTLTWVFSGLMTMSPWGLMESDGGAAVRAQLRGSATTAELRQFLESAPARLGNGDFVQLQGDVVAGRLQVIARRADGSSQRLNAAAAPDPLQAAAVEGWVRSLDTPVTQFVQLDATDTYYYGHKATVELPVYRALLDDAARTRLYISPTTGAVQVVDGAARQHRWLVGAMHSLDLAGLRARPAWDIVTLLLLAGVTAVAITGSWMALKRVRKDLSRRD